MNFVGQALQHAVGKTESEWYRLVKRNWGMDCRFEENVHRRLVCASWSMGSLQFEVSDLSSQQWTLSPDLAADNWRENMFIVFLIERGAVVLEQNGSRITMKS